MVNNMESYYLAKWFKRKTENKLKWSVKFR